MRWCAVHGVCDVANCTATIYYLNRTLCILPHIHAYHTSLFSHVHGSDQLRYQAAASEMKKRGARGHATRCTLINPACMHAQASQPSNCETKYNHACMHICRLMPRTQLKRHGISTACIPVLQLGQVAQLKDGGHVVDKSTLQVMHVQSRCTTVY